MHQRWPNIGAQWQKIKCYTEMVISCTNVGPMCGTQLQKNKFYTEIAILCTNVGPMLEPNGDIANGQPTLAQQMLAIWVSYVGEGWVI